MKKINNPYVSYIPVNVDYTSMPIPTINNSPEKIAVERDNGLDIGCTGNYTANEQKPRPAAKNNHPMYRIAKKYPAPVVVSSLALIDGHTINTTVQPDGAPSLAIVQDITANVRTSGRPYTGAILPTSAPAVTISYGAAVPSPRPLDGCYPYNTVRRAAGYADNKPTAARRRLMDSLLLPWAAAQDTIISAIAIGAHVHADTTPVYYRHITDKKRAPWGRPVNYAEYGQPISTRPIPNTDIHTGGDTQDTTAAAPAPVYKSSFAAQHTIMPAVDTPLMSIAGAVACNVAKRRYSDTAQKKYLYLQWDNSADYARNIAAASMSDLLDDYTIAAAAYMAAVDIAKRDAKILGLLGHVKTRYIDAQTAPEKTALQAAKERVKNAEKLDNTTISDFADIKSAAYIAGLELLSKFAAWKVRTGAEKPAALDCDNTINELLARNEKDKSAIAAARAAVDSTKDAAKKAGYKRLMDFAPYRAAKDALNKYRNRNLIIVMASAARKYIGAQDHGGNTVLADIDAAARRAKDVQSAENTALYKAVDSAAKEDTYYTAVYADILNCVYDGARRVIDGILRGYTQSQIARATGISQAKVSRLLAIARRDIATSDGYADNVQCVAYRAALQSL